MAEPLRYYHNITANVVNVMEAMKASTTRQVSSPLVCLVSTNSADSVCFATHVRIIKQLEVRGASLSRLTVGFYC